MARSGDQGRARARKRRVQLMLPITRPKAAAYGGALLLGACLACPLSADGPGPVARISFQEPTPAPEPGPAPQEMPSVTLGDSLLGVYPIDLLTALRLAQTNNLDILQAREVIARARAGLIRAEVQI